MKVLKGLGIAALILVFVILSQIIGALVLLWVVENYG